MPIVVNLRECIHGLAMEAAAQPQYLTPTTAARTAMAAEHDAALRAADIDEGLLTNDVASAALRSRVEDCMKALIARVGVLDVEALRILVQRNERLLAFQWTAAAPEDAGWTPPRGLPAAVLDAEHSVALRFCIEVAAAQSGGSEGLTDECFFRAWCLAREIMYCGALEDARQTDLTVVSAVVEAGRLRLAASNEFEQAMRDQRDSTLAQGKGTEDLCASDEILAELNAALADEIGLGLFDIAGLVKALTNVQATTHGVRSVERQKLVDGLASAEVSPSDVDAGLTFLSLRDDVLFKPGPDRFPWRFRRERSYVTRPLLDVSCDATRWMIWGPLALELGSRALVMGFYTKTRKGKTKRLNDAIEGVARWRSTGMETRIAEHFRSDGRFTVEQGVEKPIGSVVYYKSGHELGDMDVVVIDPVCHLIALIEAKGRLVGLTPSNIAREVADWEEIVVRHERRLRWLTEHRVEFLEHRGMDAGQPQLWRVVGHIVIRAPMASVLVARVDTRVSVLDHVLTTDRDTWLATGAHVT